ncbi:MAG TPA: FliA/WhiG family RNA polymerase sigma factor [Bryobacteraceae bacterium]|nr:FliA/WhiG family RNA polymerase sigma factor [Bryobacteraceae bacterium]
MSESKSPAQERSERILEQLPRVRWIASRIHQKLPCTVSLEDLISIGVLGLIAAVDNFDPSYNVKLQTYADHRIRGAILDSVRDLDGIPAHKRAKARRIERAVGSAEQRLHRKASSEEIAEELGISLKEYHSEIQDTRHIDVRSLEGASRGDAAGLPLVEVIPSRREAEPDYLIEQAELRELMRRGMQALPAMERTVMMLYFTEGLCLREIASSVNLHITRISQLKARATSRLRGFVQARWVAGKGGALVRTYSAMRQEPVLAD